MLVTGSNVSDSRGLILSHPVPRIVTYIRARVECKIRWFSFMYALGWCKRHMPGTGVTEYSPYCFATRKI